MQICNPDIAKSIEFIEHLGRTERVCGVCIKCCSSRIHHNPYSIVIVFGMENTFRSSQISANTWDIQIEKNRINLNGSDQNEKPWNSKVPTLSKYQIYCVFRKPCSNVETFCRHGFCNAAANTIQKNLEIIKCWWH